MAMDAERFAAVVNRLENRDAAMEVRIMTRYAALLTPLFFLTAASAQEPKAIKTVRVTRSLNDTALYEVKDDGTVLIDWAEVEALAASKQNPVLLPQA